MPINFTVPGTPRAKQRPRMNTLTHVVYTPPETREYEQEVKLAYIAKFGKIPRFAKDKALSLSIKAYFSTPESMPLRKKLFLTATNAPHIKKPDGDNIIKTVADALNGLAYRDDAQICHEEIFKIYGDPPRVEVLLSAV
jgi:Holliday junction resolvase RusA-like endonuclease